MKPLLPGRVACIPAAALALLALASSGCSGPAQVRYEEELRSTPGPGRHAIHSERLEQHMRGLERLAVERLPRAMDEQEAEGRRKAEVAEVARAMADSASRIADAAQAVELDAAERREFLALADALRQQAQLLAEEAPRLPVEEVRARAQALDARCADCHERFRIPRRPDGD
jgi:cytochrome c556